MTDALSTTGSIASFLANVYADEITTGISGNLVVIADLARQHVANYTGVSIGSNSISEKYQPAILDFARADVVDLITTNQTKSISVGELSFTKSELTSNQYRMLAEMKLKSLGRNIQFSQALS